MPETNDVVNAASMFRLQDLFQAANSSFGGEDARNHSTSPSALYMWHLMMSHRMRASSNDSSSSPFDFMMPSDLASPLVLDDVLKDLEENFHCGNGSATFKQLASFVDVSWWLDRVAQNALGAIGLFINCLALPVLLSKRLKSVFNCLLTILLFTESIFIVCTCLATLRQNLELTHSRVFNAVFAYVIYPAKSGLLYFSIYMATVMARERYMAIRCPISYHNETSGVNPWHRALWLTFPIFFLVSVFTLPIFFEAKLITRSEILVEHEVRFHSFIMHSS